MQSDRQLLQQALDALENSVNLVREDAYQAEKLYGNYPTRQGKVNGLKVLADDHEKAILALRERLAHCDRCGKRLGGEGDIHTCTPKNQCGETCERAKLCATCGGILAQPEQEFIKHYGDDEGWSEWVCPDPKSYLMKCCDCGLVHEAQFVVVRYESETEREDCEPVSDPNLQAVFRLRRSAPLNAAAIRARGENT
jgi:hypothetical protein